MQNNLFLFSEKVSSAAREKSCSQRRSSFCVVICTIYDVNCMFYAANCTFYAVK